MNKATICCEYCGKEFATRPNLLRHQRTVALCIQLQKNPRHQMFECSHCNKSYTSKNNLNAHFLRCRNKQKYDAEKEIKAANETHKEEIKILKEENNKWKVKVRALKKQLREKDIEIREKNQEIAVLNVKCEVSKSDGKVEVYDKVCTKVLDKSTVTNNTAYINPKLANLPITTIHPLTEDYVKKRVANGDYTFDHYRRGEDGVVDFINSITMCENDDGEMERNYVTTDTSRDSFHRLVETKEWEKDKGGKFIDVIFDSLNDKVNKYHNQLLDERIKYKGKKTPGGYDPETIYKRNTDLHSGIIETRGKQRQSLRKRIKKESSNKIAV